MNKPQEFCLSCIPGKTAIPDDGHPFCSSCSEAGWDTAFKRGVIHGRESVLKAAHELFGTRPGKPTQTRFDSQADRSVAALGEWCELDPKHNRYDVSMTELDSELQRWRITLWHKEMANDKDSPATRFNSRHTTIRGSTHLDCLAKGAQWAMLELENSRRK
jgi:hypothetical protein